MGEKYRVATSILRAAFVNVFDRKDWKEKDKEPKFEITLISQGRGGLDSVEKALKQAIDAEYGGNRPPEGFEYPIKYGHSFKDSEGNVYDGFEGHDKFAFKATSQFKIKIVDQRKTDIPYSEKTRLKSGDFVVCIVDAQCWQHARKEGASLYLKVVQLVRSGDPLSDGTDVGLDLLNTYEEETITDDYLDQEKLGPDPGYSGTGDDVPF